MPTYNHKVGNLGGTYAVDADLDNMRIKELPEIKLGEVKLNVTHMPRIEFADINTFSNITSTSTVTTSSDVNINKLPKIILEADTRSSLDVAIKELPDIRAHLPSHYNLGIAFFGVEIIRFSLCGESQLITEKYNPRRVEICR